MAEGAIGDWASVYLHSNLGVTLSRAAAGYAAYAVAMAAGRFTGDWLAQRVSGKTILHVSGLLIAIGMGGTLLISSWWTAVAGLMLTGIGVCEYRSGHLGFGRPRHAHGGRPGDLDRHDGGLLRLPDRAAYHRRTCGRGRSAHGHGGHRTRRDDRCRWPALLSSRSRRPREGSRSGRRLITCRC